jgi:DNA-binding MarR family transcriptional regulator
VALASLINTDRRRLLQTPKITPASLRLFELLPLMPIFSIDQVCERLNTTFPTATAAVKTLESLGIVAEQTGQKKNRHYSYQAYVQLLSS